MFAAADAAAAAAAASACTDSISECFIDAEQRPQETLHGPTRGL